MNIQEYLHQVIIENINNINKGLVVEAYNPRNMIPKVRGGWNKDKILKYLKSTPSRHGSYPAAKFIAEFDNIEELKSHIFWHGSPYHQTQLKPSITKSQRWAESYGGGGYGQRYWGISLTSNKYMATHFAGQSRGVNVHPVVLAKNAVVRELPDTQDAADVEDLIVQLYTDGIDAVYIGKRGHGEQELLVINPLAICNMDAAQYYECYQLFKDKVPMPTDEQFQELLDTSKEYVAGYSKAPRKPIRPTKPTQPSRYNLSGDNPFSKKTDDEYNADVERYNQEMSAYDQSMKDYEEQLRSFEESPEHKAWEEKRNKLRQKMRI